MISFYRIGAVVFRHLMTLKRLSWVMEVGYWPVLNIIIFGSLGKAATMMTTNSTDNIVSQVLITNTVLWFIVLRAAITIGFMLLNELFDVNLITLFATPLRKIEWIISCIIVGSIAALFTLALGMVMAFLIFNCNVFALGIPFFAIVSSLLLSGWSLGLFLMGILLFTGKKGLELAFMICWSLVPFSCVYYPIEVLPQFLQKIVWFIPMTQVFTATRAILTTGSNYWFPIIVSFVLNIIYLALAAIFFAIVFERSKKRGLAQLELRW